MNIKHQPAKQPGLHNSKIQTDLLRAHGKTQKQVVEPQAI